MLFSSKKWYSRPNRISRRERIQRVRAEWDRQLEPLTDALLRWRHPEVRPRDGGSGDGSGMDMGSDGEHEADNESPGERWRATFVSMTGKPHTRITFT